MTNRITIQNLKCGGCANTIKRKLEKLEGISDVHIEVEKSEVVFQLESDTQMHSVEESLRNMGYPTIDDENGLSTKARSFVSCATGKLMQH